jgi:hypothetical protein
MPEWAGITEPATVLTNVALALVAMWLAARLGYAAAAEGARAGLAMAGAFMGTAIAALFGAVSHGTDPRTDREVRQRFWRWALFATGLVSATTLVSVAFFATRGGARTAVLVFAGVKLVAFWIAVARRPEFRVAAADYGGALAVLLVAAVYARIRWNAAGAPWLIAAVLVSLIAGLIQARRLAPHRYFNHNDLFHVVQIGALYLFYRGGVLLVDR